MSHVALKDAKLADLERFARVNLGLDVSASETRAKLTALIKQSGYVGDTIEIDDDAATPAIATPQPSPAGVRDTVKVLIANEKGPGGEEPLPIGVNGVFMAVPRGEIVEIPRAYYEVLKNSLAIEYEMTEREGIGRGREVQTLSYQVYPS